MTDEEPVVSEADVATAAEKLGIAGAAICLHAALRSFPRLVDGPATLVEGLLSTGSTVMVATMANEAFEIPPPLDERPHRNGLDYAERDRSTARDPCPGSNDIFDPSRTEVDRWLGATSAYVAARPDRIRCRLSTGTFSAVGPMAERLIGAEVAEDVFGPLRELTRVSGHVLLAGVGLTSMTLLHLAEVMAGRVPFIRWSLGPDGRPVRSRGGECSRGFERLAPVLSPLERGGVVGKSRWRAFPAGQAVELAAAAIRAEPEITHCDDDACIECADAIAGGPRES